MSKNNGLGAVIEKNQVILQDTFELGGITATKHANGRDWWIVIKQYDSNRYNIVLVTPFGLTDFGVQTVGQPISQGLKQAVFSPDGSKYVSFSMAGINDGDFLSIFDFDRCTGGLSNPVLIHQTMDTIWSGGVAISQNSRFLYVPYYKKILQYDLQAQDVAASKKIVAAYDDYEEEVSPGIFFPTLFFLAQLAPDGKIYINCSNGVRSLHVINQPDLEGMACDVQQHSVMLPTLNKFSLPNFPNYRLGALPGSPCDTLTAVQVVEAENGVEVEIYPNPASDQLSVTVSSPSDEPLELVIYNLSGAIVGRYVLSANGIELIAVTTLPDGLYHCRIFRNSNPIHAQRVAIIH